MKKSKGHVAFVGDAEYYVQNGEIYRAPLHNAFDLDGYRNGRWEAPDRPSMYHSIQMHIDVVKKSGGKVSVAPKYKSRLSEGTMSDLEIYLDGLRGSLSEAKEMSDEWREKFEAEASRLGMVRLTQQNIRAGRYMGAVGTDYAGKLKSTKPTDSWTIFSFTRKTLKFGSTSDVNAGSRFAGRRYQARWDGWGYRMATDKGAPTPRYAYISKG